MNELFRIAEGLLKELEEVVNEWKIEKPDLSQDFSDWFAYVHTCNIGDQVSSIILLRRNEKIGPMRPLIRVALESYFNLAASLKSAEFAKNKVHSEIRNLNKRVGQWNKIKPDDQKKATAEVMSGVQDMTQLFTDNVGKATDNLKWDAYDVADVAESNIYYRTAYFTYSQHIHANFGVLMNGDKETVNTVDSSVRVAVSLLALVVGLVVIYRKKPDMIDRQGRIALLSADLAALTGWQVPAIEPMAATN